jgi:hypothetical protein
MMTRHLPACLFAVGVWMTTPACASAGYTYAYQVDSREFQRHAYDHGYRDGVHAGEKDARDHRRFSPERHDNFRDADDGYHRHDGDKEVYRVAFRDGFRAGYREGYERSAPRGGVGVGVSGSVYAGPSVPYGARATASPTVVYQRPVGPQVSPAAQIGYRDGFDVGRDDARDHESYDPVRSKRYRSADHDYDSRYGSRDEFKREYRVGFEQGYAAGYQGYWR